MPMTGNESNIRLIGRVTTPKFVLICATVGAMSGIMFFMVSGVIVAAFDASPGLLGGVTLIAFIAGVTLPIIALRRAREKANKPRPRDFRPRPFTRLDGIGGASNADFSVSSRGAADP